MKIYASSILETKEESEMISSDSSLLITCYFSLVYFFFPNFFIKISCKVG